MPTGADFKIALMLAVRARLLPTLLWLLVALVAAVFLAAQFSGRQPATVSLDVGLSIIRLGLPLMLVFLVQELFTREFDRRYFLTSLSYPRARHQFITARFISVTFITYAALAVLSTTLAFCTYIISQSYHQATPVALDHHYIITLGFIAIDLLVIGAIATLLAIVAVTPSFVILGTFGFMLIARSYSGIIQLIKSDSYVVSNPESYQTTLGILRYILPDLGSLDVRATALYGKLSFIPDNWLTLILSSVIYVAALLVLSIWLLERKRFN